jgi:hypothetical protein
MSEQASVPSTPFAHASEAEMSRILDFYAVRWEYEPHTFPILWNLEGDVVESFSPDFYLPDLDLYLEMTTSASAWSARRTASCAGCASSTRILNVKPFYARDFRALMLKYGKLALAAGLSGSSGQVASPYGIRELAAEPLDLELPLAIDPTVAPAARRRHRPATPDQVTKGPAILS